MRNPADQAFIKHLQGLGIDVIAPQPAYLEEPRGRYAGIAGGIARPPQTVEQVSQILSAAHERRIGVVPMAGARALLAGSSSPRGRSRSCSRWRR